MDNNKLLIAIIIIIVVVIGAVSAVFLIGDGSDDSNSTNSTNSTNITNITNNTTVDTSGVSSSQNSARDSSNGPSVVGESIEFNYQNGEGYYRQVEYSDGNFRQYDVNTGKLIGSSYASDQKYLPSME